MDERLNEDAVFRVAFGIESPQLREEYLRQVSLGRPALYDRVIALLEASAKSQTSLSLQQPVSERLSTSNPSPNVPAR